MIERNDSPAFSYGEFFHIHLEDLNLRSLSKFDFVFQDYSIIMPLSACHLSPPSMLGL